MSESRNSRAILIFARAPIEGKVKTRLQAVLSAAEIIALHKNLVCHAVSMAAQFSDLSIQLWVDAEAEHDFFKQLRQQFPAISLHQQIGEDLGERMAHALKKASAKAKYRVLIGSDCPELNVNYLEQAFQILSREDESQGKQLVLGPAADGGYVLLATSLNEPPIFTGIDWGTGTVYQSTVARLNMAQISYASLSVLSDIDRPDDLHLAEEFGLLGRSD